MKHYNEHDSIRIEKLKLVLRLIDDTYNEQRQRLAEMLKSELLGLQGQPNTPIQPTNEEGLKTFTRPKKRYRKRQNNLLTPSVLPTETAEKFKQTILEWELAKPKEKRDICAREHKNYYTYCGYIGGLRKALGVKPNHLKFNRLFPQE